MTNTTIAKAIKRSKTLTPQQSELKQLIQSKNFMAQVKNALPHGELTAKRYISACLTALSVTPKLLQFATERSCPDPFWGNLSVHDRVPWHDETCLEHWTDKYTGLR